MSGVALSRWSRRPSVPPSQWDRAGQAARRREDLRLAREANRTATLGRIHSGIGAHGQGAGVALRRAEREVNACTDLGWPTADSDRPPHRPDETPRSRAGVACASNRATWISSSSAIGQNTIPISQLGLCAMCQDAARTPPTTCRRVRAVPRRPADAATRGNQTFWWSFIRAIPRLLRRVRPAGSPFDVMGYSAFQGSSASSVWRPKVLSN